MELNAKRKLEQILEGNIQAVPRRILPPEPSTQLSHTCLELRPYQTQLLEQAKESNVIAVLDTGTGKVRFDTHTRHSLLSDSFNICIESRDIPKELPF